MASDDIGKAVKDARIAAAVAVAAFMLIGVLLMIDGQRNKWMAQQIEEVRRIFGEFARLTQVVSYAGTGEETPAPDVGRATADHGDGSGQPGPDLVAAPPAGEGQPANGSTAVRAANGQFTRRAGMASGPRGDG